MLHELLVSSCRMIRGEWLSCLGAALGTACGVSSHVMLVSGLGYQAEKGVKVSATLHQIASM